jgi:[ribosomal protein S5]-alanine N-acetyltransferase
MRTLAPVLAPGTLGARMQPVLEGDGGGVTLRPWRLTDAPTIVAAYEDDAIAFWHHRAMDDDAARRWLTEAAAAWDAEQDAEWAVVRDRAVVGRVALRGISLDVAQAEVSYWTVPSARGAGTATAAVDRVSRWAFEEIGFWRLVIRHSTRNEPSCRVAAAAGYAHEATLQRCHLHADGWHDVHVHTRFREPLPT